MFTGIIECLGEVVDISFDQSNITFGIKSSISSQLKIDQSVAHDGVCLTVIKVVSDVHYVTAIAETLQRTSLKNWKKGFLVNLERCMPASGRFDGHIVQGHVDCIGTCEKMENHSGSWKFFFKYQPSKSNITVEKGSITINGVSLTVVDSTNDSFSVAIIPYTCKHTNFHLLKEGSVVNLEFDIVGKYIAKLCKTHIEPMRPFLDK